MDKYKPAKPVELVGQLTEKSPYNKLMTWLRNWHKHNLGEGALEKKGLLQIQLTVAYLIPCFQ